MRKFCISILLLFYALFTSGQQLNDLYTSANDAFSKGEYNTAITLYSEIIEQYDKIPLVYIQLAHAYRYNLQYNEALSLYKYIVNTYNNKYPECFLRLAELQQILGFNEDAVKNYSLFLQSKSKDTTLLNNANESIISIKNPVSINDSINLRIDSTAQFAQYYGVTSYKKKIIYNGIPFVNDSLANYSTFNIPNEFQKEFSNIFTVKNSSFSDFCYTQSTDSMLITIRKSLLFTDNPQLYYTINKNGTWSTPLPLNINWKKDAIIIHPQIITFQSNNYFIFSSNIAGGYGGFDIWYSKILDDLTLGKPINLGKSINTSGDEICPFYHTDSNYIYFSSNRHGPIGGFDIYKSKNIDFLFGTVEKLSPPINSTYNDYYYRIIDSNAYFSSNRIALNIDSSNYYYNSLFTYTLPAKSIKNSNTDTLQKAKISTISLYFNHNSPREKDTLLYSNAYNSYKISIYTDEIDNIKNISYYVLKKQMSTFFDEYVTTNYLLINQLINEINRLASIQDTVTIELQAYTSIGGSIEFNKKLAERRINSVIQFLNIECSKKSIPPSKIVYTIKPAMYSNVEFSESEIFTKKEALTRKVDIAIH